MKTKTITLTVEEWRDIRWASRNYADLVGSSDVFASVAKLNESTADIPDHEGKIDSGSDLMRATSRYRQAMSDLVIAKERWLRYGCRVMVRHSLYEGPGVITYSARCSVDTVAVRMPNGEIWTYQLDCVEAI